MSLFQQVLEEVKKKNKELNEEEAILLALSLIQKQEEN
mgnify:CR=1 FL=1